MGGTSVKRAISVIFLRSFSFGTPHYKAGSTIVVFTSKIWLPCSTRFTVLSGKTFDQRLMNE